MKATRATEGESLGAVGIAAQYQRSRGHCVPPGAVQAHQEGQSDWRSWLVYASNAAQINDQIRVRERRTEGDTLHARSVLSRD
jgi:hypothetical protein